MRWPSRLQRPAVADCHVGAWLVLLATLPLGLRAYDRNSRIGISTWNPSSRMGVNFRTFQHAAELAQAGEPFYGVSPPGTYDWAVYLYPPITVYASYPFTGIEWTTGYAILVVISFVTAVAVTVVIVDYVESLGAALGWIDGILVLAALVLSTHAFGTFYYGNINLLLALLFVLGLWGLRTDHDVLSGVTFGIAAVFKLFPALIGLWFLRRHRWRAVGAALVTGVASLVAGVFVFGLDMTKYYFTDVVPGRAGSSLFVGGAPVDGPYYLTIQQPLSHILWNVWPTAPYGALVVLSILVATPVLAYLYYDIDSEIDRQMAIFGTIVVMLTLFPSLRWYLVLLYLPLIALLYVWREGPGRWAFLFGGVLMSVTYSSGDAVALLPWLPNPLDFVWLQLVGPSTPTLTGLMLMIAACIWYKFQTAEEPFRSWVRRPNLRVDDG